VGFGIFDGQLISFRMIDEILNEGEFGFFVELRGFFGLFGLNLFSQIIE
jgi:hypothetical protein